MTLISFATYGDRAEFITDTMSYTHELERLGRCSKHVLITHIDAAVLTGGDSLFGSQAKLLAFHLSGECATYDDLADELPDALAQVWAERVAETRDSPDPLCESTVFLLGWSPREEKFVATMYVSDQGFKKIRLSKPFLMPSSYDVRPSGMELRRLKVDNPSQQAADAFDVWAKKPQIAAPASVEQWITHAKTTRQHRSLSKWASVIVAGDLFHTVLRRGESHTRLVHTFNDQGDEFADMVAGTQHPVSLALECHCGSGKRYGTCHGGPCRCGSGRFSRVCCQQETADSSAR